MGLSSALTEPDVKLVADASTVINLIATGCAATIAAALPNRIVIIDVVPAELETGRARGHPHADSLRELIADGIIDIVSLGEVGMEHFEELVVGPGVMTLDDGEAATIAYAIEHNAVALIDERKAMRICAERFPSLRIACTVDVLRHPQVVKTLEHDELAEAVFRALINGRMSVLPRHLEYVVELIGPDRAALCPSLPKSARSPVPG